MSDYFKEKAEEIRQKRKAPPRKLTWQEDEERVVRGYFATVMGIIMLVFCATPVMAAGDPLTTINNLSDFIFGAIKAIGIIMLGFGIVQIGLSLKSHDASQRANGLMTFFGGVIIAFAKNILDLILK